MDILAEGGHEDRAARSRLPNNLSVVREAPRPMFPWEFTDILQAYKHPRWASIGVEATIYGNAPRKEVGIDPCGSVWVAPAAVYYSNGKWLSDDTQGRTWVCAVPQNIIPYTTLRSAIWDEDRLRWTGGEIKRGWRNALEELLKAGHLRPHAHLSYLLGLDTFQMGKTFEIL